MGEEQENPLADELNRALDDAMLVGEGESHDMSRNSRRWVTDSESDVLAEFNANGGDALRQSNNRVIATSEFGASVKTGGRITEKIFDPTNLDLDEEESLRELRRQEKMTGLTGMVQKWWAVRQVEANKDYGMDPFIRARIGQQGRWKRTDCFISKKGQGEEVYRNPKFNDTHNRTLTLRRSARDGGEVIVEAMDEEPETERFIGGCHVHLTEFIQHAELTADWKHTMFHLFDKQQAEDAHNDDDEAEERDAGGVHALARWVPELDDRGMWLLDDEKKARGVLEIKVMSAADLRDISGMKISDISSFADQTALEISATMQPHKHPRARLDSQGDSSDRLLVFPLRLSICIVVCVIIYRYFMWADENVDWDARNADYPVLDTAVFVMMTICTVGFGDQPLIGSGTDRLSK